MCVDAWMWPCLIRHFLEVFVRVRASWGHWELGADPVVLQQSAVGEKRIPCGPYFCTVFPEIEWHDSVPFVSR